MRRDGTVCTMCTHSQQTATYEGIDGGGGVRVRIGLPFLRTDSRAVGGLGVRVVGRFRTAATCW